MENPAMRFHATSERAARAVYGTIVALAVLIGFEETKADAGEIVAAMAGAVIAAQLAELYAQYIADVIRHERMPAPGELRARLGASAAGTIGALVPAIPFVLADTGAISLGRAFDIAPWLGLGTLAGYTLLANRLAGVRGSRNLITLASVLAIGVLLVALKAIA
jgi:hypothetical protein